MNEEQNINQLPKGWKWEVSSNILDIRDGTHDTPKYVNENGIPLITSKNLKQNKIDFEKVSYISKEDHAEISKRSKVEAGDILFAMIGTIGNPAIIKGDANFSIKNVGLFKKNEDEILPSFLVNFLRSHTFEKQLNERKLLKGTTQKFIPLGNLRNINIPLPPKPTQQAIVSKIEELFSELDKAIENLSIAQQQLKTYRQSVLKWAFEGKFTEQWRIKERKLSNGNAFVKQLNDEREQQQKINKVKLKPIPPIEDEELLELPKLPKQFAWARLGNLLWSVKDGPHYSPKYQSTGIPFISGGNIRPTGVDFSNAKFISEELHNELSQRCKPEKGDVLYTKGGTTGIARVNTYDIDFNVWVHVAVLKTLKSINPFYLEHALNSTHCYKQSQKYTHGVGNQDLGLTRMILITLPICSYEEQGEIVQEIESRLSVADKMEESITQSLQQAEALRQSILKKAFEGQLV